MIEFKADCGHTLQLPDREAGKVVKCAYCGREVEAPSGEDHDPDFLFREVDITELAKGEGPTGAGAITIKGRQKRAKAAPSAEQVIERGNTAMRITMVSAFAVICVLVLIVVLRSVLHITDPRPGTEGGVVTSGSPPAVPPPLREPQPSAGIPERRVPELPPPPVAAVRGRLDYDFAAGSSGVLVETLSRSARIYVRSADSLNPEPLGVDDSEFRGTGTLQLDLQPGQYTVAVVMLLSDPALRDLPGFEDLNTELELGGDAADASGFFAADAAQSLVYIDDLDVSPRLARYYDVAVGLRNWSLISSLFVPGSTPSALINHLPAARRYAFDAAEARTMFAAAEVPEDQHSTLVDVLERIGQVVVTRKDGHRIVLEIHPQDGLCSSREAPRTDAGKSPDPPADPPSDTVRPPQRPVSPWQRGRPRPLAAADTAAGTLEAVRVRLSRKQDDGETVSTATWARYLSGGTEHDLWAEALPAERTALLALIDPPTVKTLIDPLGETLLIDPDLEVRLAILDALVATADRRVIEVIDRRIAALQADVDGPAQDIATERRALEDARRRLAKPSGARKNPWER